MNSISAHAQHLLPANARRRLLSTLPVTQRRITLAGISTAVLEGGEGAPMVLLHGPGGNATHWMRVIPQLATTHRVVVPDLPGQGESDVGDAALDVDRVLEWLDELIGLTCTTPPALVGYALGGAIAARFASEHGHRLNRLVLVDCLGLRPFEPALPFAQALNEFLQQPGDRTHDALWRHCAHDLDGLRMRMGEDWEAFRSYNVDRAGTPGVTAALGALMTQFGVAAIAPAALARITVPTTLIWGRHDLATPLQVAQAASKRFGWPLHVIDDAADDPAVERPDAFVQALHAAIEASPDRR